MSSPTDTAPVPSGASTTGSASAPSLTVLSKSLVLPSAGTVQSAVHKLTELDAVFPDFFIIQLVYFFRTPKGDSMSAENLKASLSLLLSSYPILLGQQVRNPQTGRVTVTVDAEHLRGIPFVVGKCNVPLESLGVASETNLLALPFVGGPMRPPVPLPLTHQPNMAALGDEPLLALNHTTFSCGGVSIGMTMNHFLSDGEGWAQVINNWGAINRALLQLGGATKLSLPISASQVAGWVPPSFGREHFDPTPDEVANAAQVAAQDALVSQTRPATREWMSVHGPPPPPVAPIGVSIVRFSPAELSVMKSAAAPPAPGYVSTFEALTAHTFLCLSKVRKLEDKDGKVHMSFVSNGRTRHKPPAEKGWLGNFALHSGCDELLPSEVAQLSLADAAALVHREVLQLGHERLRFLMRFLREQPHCSGVFFNMRSDRDFGTNCWMKFDLYGCDFGGGGGGSGLPWKVLPAMAFPVEGLALLIPAGPDAEGRERRGESGVDMVLFAKQRELDKLEGELQGEWRRFRPLQGEKVQPEQAGPAVAPI